MKFFALFSFLGFIAAVSSAAINPLLSTTSDVQSRDSWEAEYPRDLVPEEYLQDRDAESSIDYLAARDYLEARDVDSISEREFSELEERNPAIVLRVAIQAIKLIVKAVKAAIEKDKKMRGEWTKHMVERLRGKYPHHNFVVCHTKHTTSFAGVQGKDWGHSHHEVKVSFHKTVGFEIYWFNKGTFVRQGDGGYLNWSYGGNVVSKSKDGKTLNFGKP